MSEKIRRVLRGEGGSYILPFFWQHGEDESVLRHYMRVIRGANIKEVCVESRPHPDFCGPKWWADMDAILDEAEKLGMRVWILDDSHFPTGYANGAMRDKPPELQRWYITCRRYCPAGGETLHIPPEELFAARPYGEAERAKMFMPPAEEPLYTDDRLLGAYAVNMDGGFENGEDLSGLVTQEGLDWTAPEGRWRVYLLQLTRNRGAHKDYINMLDKESCRVLIDAVYEPHWRRYKDRFGSTIAGFFSDEPELGDGVLYDSHNEFGCSPSMDYPWSRELEGELSKGLGENFALKLALLWENDADEDLTARVRYAYMDGVSRLVRECFSYPLGDWCRERGVRYIGHLIEDNNHHNRTGMSLGHYFRGLEGQDMAGIDDIGGQVLPKGEDLCYDKGPFMRRDGRFYHYGLGKLASSAAAIEPMKNGNSMCEIFGAYGWKEGVRLEKYLIDHFMVRGVNHFVPHAFSPAPFPDPDCPPHFYAHGHNPQYRHFGALMAYSNRVCELISGGRHISPAAVIYHGDSGWMGDAEPSDAVGRALYDRQIDYDFIPWDVFKDRDKYRTKISGGKLFVNTQEYRALIVPRARFLPQGGDEAIEELRGAGVPVYLGLPENIAELEGLRDLIIEPENDRVRVYRYEHADGSAVLMLVNEGEGPYSGELTLSDGRQAYEYDAWENALRPLDIERAGDRLTVKLELLPLKSRLIILDKELPEGLTPAARAEGEEIGFTGPWRRSVCKALDYPAFGDEREITLPDNLAGEQPEFSGFARYENGFMGSEGEKLTLMITDAYEGIEVFVNGKSLGIQIAPPFVCDISGAVREGENALRIEAATTLEREMSTVPSQMQLITGQAEAPDCPSGINGAVRLFKTR